MTSSDLLAAWEAGAARRPLDRALAVLWAAAAGGDDPAGLPLAERDRRLLVVRAETFGTAMGARATCPGCGLELEMELDARVLAGSLDTDDSGSLRPLTSRDLAAAAAAGDAAAAVRARIAGPDLDPDAAAAADRAITEAAERAELSTRLTCADCGAEWTETLDVPAFVWAEVEAAAVGLLTDVAELAAAYGWAERDILAMSPARRSAYLARARMP
jgi:hypothetical protein